MAILIFCATFGLLLMTELRPAGIIALSLGTAYLGTLAYKDLVAWLKHPRERPGKRFETTEVEPASCSMASFTSPIGLNSPVHS